MFGASGLSGTYAGTAFDYHLQGSASSDNAGIGVAIGDVDGDGIYDLLSGASGTTSSTGAVGLLLGVAGL
jgi:hypothetical protein